jgi:hypothetical protein
VISVLWHTKNVLITQCVTVCGLPLRMHNMTGTEEYDVRIRLDCNNEAILRRTIPWQLRLSCAVVDHTLVMSA